MLNQVYGGLTLWFNQIHPWVYKNSPSNKLEIYHYSSYSD